MPVGDKGARGDTANTLPGFGTQCFDFVFFDELTASELLYLSVQITDVPHCDTHRESCSHTTVTQSSGHGPGGQRRNPALSLSSPATTHSFLGNGQGPLYASCWVFQTKKLKRGIRYGKQFNG